MPSNEQVVLKEFDKFMDKFIDRVFYLSQDNLVRQNKIDTGTLLKTANIERQFLNKQIVYPASYADHVEFGRSKGSFPPVAPLQKWARRKLGIKEKEAKSVGWAIAKSIQKRGIAASPFLRPGIEKARQEFGV